MSLFLRRIRANLVLIVPLTLLFSCNSPSQQLAEPSPSVIVQAFETATLTSENTSEPIVPEASATPAFTATPISYAIVEGDTLLAIAERNGISLDNLLLANPGIDARFLSIGQEIFVPGLVAANESGLGIAAGIELKAGNTSCFASVAGELWCFFLVENNQVDAVENTSAQIQLFSSSGELLSEKQAYGQLQKLDSGAKMPLVAYWAQAPAAWSSAESHLTGAFLLDDPGARYLDLELSDLAYSLSDSGKSALVTASIHGLELTNPNSINILAIAYADDGRVIGTRRQTLADGENTFSFELYSLGPEIVELEVLLEALR